MKKDVAAPAAQGTKNWNEKGFGFKAVFKGNVRKKKLKICRKIFELLLNR